MKLQNNFQTQTTSVFGKNNLSAVGLILVALALAGCSSPAVRAQRLVAKPNMTFSSSAAFSYNSSKLMPQLAPGIAGAGASQNSGCTSCR